jgi:hypothetical protein
MAGAVVTPDDEALLDRVRALHAILTHRTVLLVHVRSDVDVFAEGLRDLGHDLRDLGDDLLRRVDELDACTVPAAATQTRENVWCAGQLAGFPPLGPRG